MKRSGPLKSNGFARPERIEAREVTKLKMPKAEAKPPKGPKQRKCAVKTCRAPFTPPQSFVSWCGPECGAIVAMERVAKQKAKEQRAERQETKKKLLEHKPIAYWLAITERHCNAVVRMRDPDECISCGVRHSIAWQAGHFISVGANSTLRFNLDNIHKQCIKCNMQLGGNPIPYEAALRLKIGNERVDWLKSWHPPVKMTAAYAQELAAEFRAMLKELKGKQCQE